MPGIPYRYVLYLHMKNRQTNQSAAPSLSFFFLHFSGTGSRERSGVRARGTPAPAGRTQTPNVHWHAASKKKKKKEKYQYKSIYERSMASRSTPSTNLIRQWHIESKSTLKRARAPHRTAPAPAPGTRHPGPGSHRLGRVGHGQASLELVVWSSGASLVGAWRP